MPKVFLQGDAIWAVPPSRDILTDQQQFTYELAQELQSICASAMTRSGFDTRGNQVVVRCLAPLPLVINGDNLEITFAPNFTPERQAQEEAIRDHLIDLVTEFTGDWVISTLGEAGTWPTIAYDIDFTMGIGGLTNTDGLLKSTWP